MLFESDVLLGSLVGHSVRTTGRVALAKVLLEDSGALGEHPGDALLHQDLVAHVLRAVRRAWL